MTSRAHPHHCHQGARGEWFALTPHGGSTNFVITLFGERVKLDELRRTDEFEAFVFKLMNNMSGVAVVPGVNSAGIQSAMSRRDKAL